jgi:hypothetical protein
VHVTSVDPILVGAGDISSCSDEGDSATAQLIAGIPGATVFTLGDNVYPDGTAEQFTNCYDPTWGAVKAVTHPSPGNHDYHTPGAAGYFGYFGAAAGDPAKGYYSYDLGAWHLIVLNSECSEVGGCERGSPQGLWLATDLAAHPTDCTLAYWHRPRFSSGSHGSNSALAGFWELLFEARADVVLSGHDHLFERFAAQDPSGLPAPGRGIREFVVGTGGKSLYSFNAVLANSEARYNTSDGVLKLILRSGTYDWEFVTVPNGAVADSGSGKCVTDPVEQTPTVGITAPEHGATFPEGTAVTFTGSALDPEDGDISAGLAWTSNLAGSLGTGSPLEVTGLTSGTHVVTAAATDADGNISTAQISVVVFSGQASSMVEVRVGASADDAEEKANGKISPANSDIELVFDGSNQVVGIRFASLAVPAKATISNAWVQFGTDEVKSAAVSLLVQAQAADQASGFTTALRSISSRPRTSAQVAWAPVPWLVVGEAGAAQRTPNLAAVIQEVVNRPGWVAGNPLVILITGSGVRTAESWDGKAALAPLLHVEFSPPPG